MNWLRNREMLVVGVLLGALGGYLYWYFIGCASGTCAITSVWWRSTLYGGLIGGLVFDLIKDNIG